MTYIEWRNELEGYLKNVPKDEKEKLFSYYAEMYADKRESGLSESEIISGFGAPYDVAQNAMSEGREAEPTKTKTIKDEVAPKKKSNTLFIILMLCFGWWIILTLVIVAVSLTVSIAVIPASLIISGVTEILTVFVPYWGPVTFASICTQAGEGLMRLGIGVATLPLYAIIKYIWKGISAFFKWIGMHA